MAFRLWIDPAMGMAGDMFSAGLISLGANQDRMIQAMTRTAQQMGSAQVQVEAIQTPEGIGYRLRMALEEHEQVLPASRARVLLQEALAREDVEKPYAAFAQRALEILIAAEREAHSSGRLDFGPITIQPIGVAHTPYQHLGHSLEHEQHHVPQAHGHGVAPPYQPQPDAEGAFWVALYPEFAAGLQDVATFSHVYLLSWLHGSRGYSLRVTPPWQRGKKRVVGLFASRSPNRPNPIGLTLTEVRGVEGNRLLTGPLDLFDGTPILDIKPYVRSLEPGAMGNDGWLADTDHLALHQQGIPHSHAGEEAVLHEAQDMLLDVVGAAVGLQSLRVDLHEVVCLSPVSVGGGTISFSHGVLPAPAPATTAILKRYRIPHVAGPVDVELLTPTGAALLAALQPRWMGREPLDESQVVARGMGLGTRNLRPLNALRLALFRK